jgi:hypothetical protein
MNPELATVMLLPNMPMPGGIAADAPPKIPPELLTVPVCRLTPIDVPETDAPVWTTIVLPVSVLVP